MAILNLTDLHHVGRPPFSLAFLLLYSFLGLPGIGIFYRHGRIDVTWFVLPWRYWPYSRYAVCRGTNIDVMPAIQLLIISTRFLLPWDIGTSSRSTGTLEPRDIGTQVHREEKGPCLFESPNR